MSSEEFSLLQTWDLVLGTLFFSRFCDIFELNFLTQKEITLSGLAEGIFPKMINFLTLGNKHKSLIQCKLPTKIQVWIFMCLYKIELYQVGTLAVVGPTYLSNKYNQVS